MNATKFIKDQIIIVNNKLNLTKLYNDKLKQTADFEIEFMQIWNWFLETILLEKGERERHKDEDRHWSEV